ncbi:hypothetical protein AMST5_01096 [freshwater sediment metagenome]|uniref:Uncharacterized protein n=1 Tax=freshwater sediment metagenome TaxID=556182 RepID=A0AA48LZF1_9ZZZZ
MGRWTLDARRIFTPCDLETNLALVILSLLGRVADRFAP